MEYYAIGYDFGCCISHRTRSSNYVYGQLFGFEYTSDNPGAGLVDVAF
jgi:hypothetical protein